MDAPAPDAASADGCTPPMDAAFTPDGFVPSEDAGTDAGTDAAVALDAGPPPGGCTPLPVSGALTLTGTLDGSDPTWERPLATSCPASGRSSVGTAAGYDTFVLCNMGATGNFEIALDGSGEPGSYTLSDPYLVIYAGAMIPADELMCLDGDDDGNTSNGSLVDSVPVSAGASITVVPSGFDNTDLGTYGLRITRL